jgi:hypothetical protein
MSIHEIKISMAQEQGAGCLCSYCVNIRAWMAAMDELEQKLEPVASTLRNIVDGGVNVPCLMSSLENLDQVLKKPLSN